MAVIHQFDWVRSKSFFAPVQFTLIDTVEPRYNEVLGTMKITLLYQVSHYIRAKKQRNMKSWDQQNYLVITGFCYIRPLYNEVPLYLIAYILTHLPIHQHYLFSLGLSQRNSLSWTSCDGPSCLLTFLGNPVPQPPRPDQTMA